VFHFLNYELPLGEFFKQPTMILLNKKYYHKVNPPLSKVTFNNLFARSVVEQHISGKIYVDQNDNPQTFLVIHPYGMSLLFGNWNNVEFNEWFKTDKGRDKHEWMQAFPHNWNAVLEELFNGHLIKSSDNTDNRQTGIIELNTRINFRFKKEKFLASRAKNMDSDMKIVPVNQGIFHEMKGFMIF